MTNRSELRLADFTRPADSFEKGKAQFNIFGGVEALQRNPEPTSFMEMSPLLDIKVSGSSARELSDAMDSVVFALTHESVNGDLPSTDKPLSEKILIGAKHYFDANGIPFTDRYIGMTPSSVESLLQEVSSEDAVNLQAVMKGEATTYMGFTIIQIADHQNCQIPSVAERGDSVIRSLPVWHKDAIGYDINEDDVFVGAVDRRGLYRILHEEKLVATEAA